MYSWSLPRGSTHHKPEASFYWEAPNTGASPTGYRMYFGTSTGVYTIGPINDSGVDLTEVYSAAGLSPNTTYFGVVRAFNGDGESGNSNEIQVLNGVQVGP